MSQASSSADSGRQASAASSTNPAYAAAESVETGEVEAPFRYVHDKEREFLGTEEAEQRALCLSGGGIRSATFSLGVLQGLADRKLLSQFDYLSTVSGGGYIGSWLSAWIARTSTGVVGVEAQLKSANYPEPDPIRHLRRYSNYLTPKLGPFSPDNQALASIVLRNLLLNWLVLVPVFFAALLAPRFALSMYGRQWSWDFATGGAISLSLFGLGIAFAITGLKPTGSRGNYQFFATLGCFLLSAILLPLELQVDKLYEKWGNWLGDALALTPWLAIPVGVMFGIYVFTWKRAQRFSQYLRIANATTIGLWLLVAAVYLLVARVIPGAEKHDAVRVAYVTPLLLLGLLLVGYVVTGLTHTNESEQHREWLSSLSGSILGLALAWAAIGTLAFYGPQLYELGTYRHFGSWVSTNAEQFERMAKGITAIGGIIGGLYTAFKGHEGKSASGRNGAGTVLISTGTALGVFVVALALSLSALADVIIPAVDALSFGETHFEVLSATRPGPLLALIAALVLVAAVLSRYISLNKFSLHSMYRNRLVKAYLGASRTDKLKLSERFIPRYDPDDDLELRELAFDPDMPDTAKGLAPNRDGRPLHLVNMALNLNGDENLAWQERRAESFVASPLHVGFERPGDDKSNSGFRPTKFYGGFKDKPVTLGTAMAISGAAANPNMGYHSSPLVTFVMTLFNARLGWWLGNPGKPGSAARLREASWVRSGPAFSLHYLLCEALGWTTDAQKFVNLSDGGHFENLGIYEAVRRQCRVIVVVDGGCDSEYTLSDLGNAICKCRVDFGAEIDFGKSLQGIRDRTSRCAIATITYNDKHGDPHKKAQVGRLVYVKPMILPQATQSEPVDVLAYHSEHATFPNETTADQFFSESQFESYRRLGLHTILTSAEFKDEVSLFVDNGVTGRSLMRSTPPGRQSHRAPARTA